jgi:hypothetical protein
LLSCLVGGGPVRRALATQSDDLWGHAVDFQPHNVFAAAPPSLS